MRTIVYIDGFNLYYRLLDKRPAIKWLNPERLVSLVLDEKHEVVKVNYYTARVSGRVDPEAPKRQGYRRIRSSLPLVESRVRERP